MENAQPAISPRIPPSTTPIWSSLRDLIQTKGIHGKVIVSAELGLNHDGDVSRALQMIDAAAEAGCQAVKVQNYRTWDVVQSKTETITVDGTPWNAWDLFSRCELTFGVLGLLAAHANRLGLVFHSTPTNEQGIRDLKALDVPLVKIASDMLPALSFTQGCLRTFGGNVVASTGLTWYDPGESAKHDWVWLACVREYPAKAPNLGQIRTLREWGADLVGYSDHTRGLDACGTAYRHYGACWLECHVTLDHALPGPDHRWSKDFTEMAELVRWLKER
jgi:sialic acid synthase SpsE